ncbi:hypothetical protein [Bosea sp. (in: a-proteobacteria)]|uniref:hypothetical protein n=1 Tax=Bosea sp. (in: a-proteobacteria) TaxID=1871050 RepID=UPI003B3A92AC
MPSQPITAEDLGAALAGFALSFAAVIMSPHHQTTDEVLEALANELHELKAGMTKHGDTGTPAAEALGVAGDMLMASETRRG